MEKSAPAKIPNQSGAIPTILIIIGAIVVIVVILVATGVIKFSGYVKFDKSEDSSNQTGQSYTLESPSPSPSVTVQLVTTPYTNNTLGFSISYPEGWTRRDNTSSGVAFTKISETKSNGAADAVVAVFSAPIGDLKDSKLATIADLHRVQLKKQFSNVVITDETETTIGGQNAYEMDYTATIDGQDVQGRYIVITSPTNLYALMGMADASMWDKFKDAIEASFQTFDSTP